MDDEKLLGLLREALAEAEDERTAAEAKVARRLAALKAFDGCGATPIEVAHMASAAKREQAKAAHPSAPKRKVGASKYDFAEVARVATDAINGGHLISATMEAHFEVNKTTANWLVSEARKRGHDIPRGRPSRPRGGAKPKPVIVNGDAKPVDAGLGPIDRTPVDHQAARDAAAGPSTGPVKGLTTRPAPHNDGRPANPTVGQAWTPERALAVIEGGA